MDPLEICLGFVGMVSVIQHSNAPSSLRDLDDDADDLTKMVILVMGG